MPINGVHRPGAGVALDRPGFPEAAATAGGLPSGADIRSVNGHGFPLAIDTRGPRARRVSQQGSVGTNMRRATMTT